MFEAIAGFTMVVAAFFATGFAFWALAVAAFIAVMIFSESDSNFWAAGIVILFVAIMQANGTFAIFSDPLSLLKYAALYFVGGACWSSVKWYFFLLNRGDEFSVLKLKWIEEYNKANTNSSEAAAYDFTPLVVDIATEIPDSQKRSFRDFLERKNYLSDYDETRKYVIPNWRNCKERITTWILWWPTSFLWTMLNDPLVRLAKWIYQRLGGVYERITNMVFGKFGDASQYDDI